MASYLISFAYKAMQAIGPCPRYGSHILHLTQPPASQEVAEDLARTVAMV
jgi:hypothetical protein